LGSQLNRQANVSCPLKRGLIIALVLTRAS
jgi:hypothetical protein